SARSNPRMCLIRVVLPAPFSPTSPNTHPRGTSNDTSFNAAFDPNRRDKLVMATTAFSESRIDLPSFPACSQGGDFVLDQPAEVKRGIISVFYTNTVGTFTARFESLSERDEAER